MFFFILVIQLPKLLCNCHNYFNGYTATHSVKKFTFPQLSTMLSPLL